MRSSRSNTSTAAGKVSGSLDEAFVLGLSEKMLKDRLRRLKKLQTHYNT